MARRGANLVNSGERRRCDGDEGVRVSDEGEEERRNEVEGVACGLGSNETT